MPPEDEYVGEIEEIASVTDDAGASQEARTPATSASSAENDVSNTVADDDALSVVREVVGERESKEAAASSAKGEEGAGEIAGGSDPKEAEVEQPPFHKHPAWVRQQGMLHDTREKLKTAEVDAQRYRNVQTFLDNNGLDGKEAAELLTIGGLIKTDPAEAWLRMQSTVQAVLRASGEVLPDDLAEMVRSGQMMTDAALEVSRARASVQAVRAGQSLEQQRAERRRQQEAEDAARSNTETLQTTAVEWAQSRHARDPNFDAKLPAIEAEVKRLIDLGWNPPTAEAVREQLDRAYRAVNARLQPRTIVQRPAVTPIRGGQVNGAARPAPKNTLDIIQQVVGQRASAS